MVLPIFAALERLDSRLLEAGADLYASPRTTFRTVTWPLSMPGVVAGTLLTFIPAAGDYVNASLLGNNTNTTMVGRSSTPGSSRSLDYPTAASLSVVLMVAILVLVGAVHPARRDGGPAVSAPRRRPRAIEVLTTLAARRTRRCADWLRKPRRRLGDMIVPIFAALAFVYLLVPVAYTVAFSFNDAGKTNLVWRGFTLDNWQNPCGAPQVCEAFANSLQVGLVSTLVATVLGTLMAIALVRFRFRGRALTNLLIFLPMSTPEVVLGAALLAQFLSVRVPLGVRHGRHRPRDVLHQLRRRDGQGPGVQPGPGARGGRGGPVRLAVAGVLAGDLPARCCRGSRPRRCSRSA